MSVQIILRDGQPEWAVIPYDAYTQLMEDAEMLADIREYDAAKQALAEGEELVPAAVVDALLAGENPIKVWRNYRQMTQRVLAENAGISPAYLSQLESGARRGLPETLSRIAQALDLTLDDLA
ncbi:MAG: helix-turn-helix transcriptional regulator [Ardenticatenaceae bacterium]|nr:helix-turn-helix transcriptional regulator [Ardenticatenaceae bacterium]